MSLPPPNYTQMPNVILDNMAKFQPGEILVLFAAVRHTIGWHREEAEMSISWFQAQTGLSKNGVIKARDSLIKQDYLAESVKRGCRGVKLYSVKIGTISATTIPPDEQVLYHSVDPLKKVVKEKDKSLTEIKPTPEKPLPDKCVVERRCANCQGMKAFKDGDRFTCCGCGQLFGKDGPTPPHPAPAKEPSAHKQLERALLDGLGWQPGDMSGDDFARLGAAVKSLLKKGAPPSNGDIGDFFDWDKKTFEDGYRATTGQSVVGKWARFRAAQRKASTPHDDKPEMMVG